MGFRTMGHIKKNWILFSNKVLSFLLLVLGFNSCSDKGEPCMYGMPPARYEVKTTVLDEAGKPIKGIQVDVKSSEQYIIERGQTNVNGI